MDRFIQSYEIQHEGMIHDTSFNYFGNRIANSYGDGHIVICDLDAQQEVSFEKIIEGHTGPVWQISWAHPKFGSLLASCGFDRKIIIWKEFQQNDWKQYRVFYHHQNSVNSVTFCDYFYGLRLAAGSSDGMISVLWKQGYDWEKVQIVGHEMSVSSIVWGGHFKQQEHLILRLISGSCDTTIKVWGYDTKKNTITLMNCLRDHSDWIRDISWNDECQIIVSGSEDKTVKFWQLKQDKYCVTKTEKFEGPIWKVQWSFYGNILAVSSANQQSDSFITMFGKNPKGEIVNLQSIDQQK